MKNFTSSVSLGNFQTSKLPIKIVSFLIFICFTLLLNGQPTKKSEFSLNSTLGHGNSEDWPVYTFPSEDCIHVYFCGWTIYEGTTHCNNTTVELRVPIIGKYNALTNTLVWEKEYYFYKSDEANSDGFLTIFEYGNEVTAFGSNSSCDPAQNSGPFMVKVDAATGNLLPGYPKWTGDISPNTFPVVENGIVTGAIGFKGPKIFITDRDGNIDPNFGNNGYLESNLASAIYRCIKIENHPTVKYAYTGYKTISSEAGHENYDIVIGAADINGDILWEFKTTEMDLSLAGKYTDIQTNDGSICKDDVAFREESSWEWGWDLVQEGSNIFVSCVFDGRWLKEEIKTMCNPGPVQDLETYHYEDVGILKVDLADGNIINGINVGCNEAADYYPDIDIKDGKIYILGARRTNDNPITFKAAINTFSTYLNPISEKVFGSENWNINCSFSISFDCNGDMIVSGDNEKDGENYYFYRLSNECQNRLHFNGYDVVFGKTITGTVNWNTDRKVKATVIVTSGSTLNINNCTIQFGASWEMIDFDKLAQNDPSFKLIPKIVVENGGTLNLNGCTLKGLTACNSEWMWDGIELRNGGIINSNNGATIQDAKIGILVDKAKYDAGGRLAQSETDGGGTAQIIGSNIINCFKGMHFAPCTDNTSTISSTNFFCNSFMKDASFYQLVRLGSGPNLTKIGVGTSIFVSANQAKGMKFIGSSWTNTLNIPLHIKGIGISSYGSKYEVLNNCSMNNLYLGINALGGADPTVAVTVNDGNTFNQNWAGIRFMGGKGNRVSTNNIFNLNYYYTPPPYPHSASSAGILNYASQFNVYDDFNNFIQVYGVPASFHSVGVLSDETLSQSYHQKNNFTHLSAGEQIQVDNTGLKLLCNNHQIRENAWKVYGILGNQGDCMGLKPYTPGEKFDIICQQGENNHIDNLDVSFKYFLKNGVPKPPLCYQNVVIELCENSLATSGCDILIPKITNGNQGQYLDDVNSTDGIQDRVVINELIKYYSENNQLATADSLLALQSEDSYKMIRILLQLNHGSVEMADGLLTTLTTSSNETIDFNIFYQVLRNAKLSSTPLWILNEASINNLQSIASHRSVGGYAANAILSFYYDMESELIIETGSSSNSSAQSLSQSELQSVSNSAISYTDDQVKIRLNSESHDKQYSAEIISLDGRLFLSKTLGTDIKNYTFSISSIQPGVYLLLLKDQKGIISKSIINKN